MQARIASLILLGAVAAAAQQLEIVSARYGAGNAWLDVTNVVRGMVADNRVAVRVDVPTLGSDPAPGVGKRLEVRYRFNGREEVVSAADFETLLAPASTGRFSISDLFSDRPQQSAPAQPAVVPLAPTLRIVSARWGTSDKSNDVTARLQSQIKDDRLTAKADNATMGGDPAVGKAKNLVVQYEFRGSIYEISVKEGGNLNLPDAAARLVSSVPVSVPTAAPAATQLRIVSARYGTTAKSNDVTARLQALVKDDKLSTVVDNHAMGGDPIMGQKKKLTVQYEYRGVSYESAVDEGATLSLPAVTSVTTAAVAPTAASPGSVAPVGNAGGLRVFYARYGLEGERVDVRDRLRPYLQGDRLSVPVNAQVLGDPRPGARKSLNVIYEFRGRTFEKLASDGETLVLP